VRQNPAWREFSKFFMQENLETRLFRAASRLCHAHVCVFGCDMHSHGSLARLSLEGKTHDIDGPLR